MEQQGGMSEPEDGEILDENEESPFGSGAEGEYEHRRYRYNKNKSKGRRDRGRSSGRSRVDQYGSSRTDGRRRSQGSGGSNPYSRHQHVSNSRSRSRGSRSYSRYGNCTRNSSRSRRSPSPSRRTSGSGSVQSKLSSRLGFKTQTYMVKMPLSDARSHGNGRVDGSRSKLVLRRYKASQSQLKKLTDHSHSGSKFCSSSKDIGASNRSSKLVPENLLPVINADHNQNMPSSAPISKLLVSNGSTLPRDGFDTLHVSAETDPVSDDDDDSSVQVIPEDEIAALKKSPMIITLDTTDTDPSDDEESQKSCGKPVQSKSTMPGSGNGLNVRASDDMSTANIKPHDKGSEKEISKAGGMPNPTNAGNDVSGVIQIGNVSRVATTSNKDSTADSFNNNGANCVNQGVENGESSDMDEEIYELELRKKLLADLSEKTVKQELASASKAPIQNRENLSLLQKSENCPMENKNAVGAPECMDEYLDEEENALREVLLSQMANKRKRKVVVGRQNNNHTNDERIITGEESAVAIASRLESSQSLYFVVDPLECGSMNVPDLHLLSNTIINSPNSPYVGQSPGQGSGKKSVKTTPTNRRGNSSARGRRGRNNGQRNRNRSGGLSLQMSQLSPSSGLETLHHRMVRLGVEPLRNLPHGINRSANVRNLPDNDLRNKLLRNRRNEQQSQDVNASSLTSLFPEFGVADTDMRQDTTVRLLDGVSDMTIRRTVNFESNYCPSSAAASSTARTYMAPINVDIPLTEQAALQSPCSARLQTELLQQNSPYTQHKSPLCPTPFQQRSPALVNEHMPLLDAASSYGMILTAESSPQPGQTIVHPHLNNPFQNVDPFEYSSHSINAPPTTYASSGNPFLPNTSLQSSSGVIMSSSSYHGPSEVGISLDVDHRVNQHLVAPMYYPGNQMNISDVMACNPNIMQGNSLARADLYCESMSQTTGIVSQDPNPEAHSQGQTVLEISTIEQRTVIPGDAGLPENDIIFYGAAASESNATHPNTTTYEVSGKAVDVYTDGNSKEEGAIHAITTIVTLSRCSVTSAVSVGRSISNVEMTLSGSGPICSVKEHKDDTSQQRKHDSPKEKKSPHVKPMCLPKKVSNISGNNTSAEVTCNSNDESMSEPEPTPGRTKSTFTANIGGCGRMQVEGNEAKSESEQATKTGTSSRDGREALPYPSEAGSSSACQNPLFNESPDKHSYKCDPAGDNAMRELTKSSKSTTSSEASISVSSGPSRLAESGGFLTISSSSLGPVTSPVSGTVTASNGEGSTNFCKAPPPGSNNSNSLALSSSQSANRRKRLTNSSNIHPGNSNTDVLASNSNPLPSNNQGSAISPCSTSHVDNDASAIDSKSNQSSSGGTVSIGLRLSSFLPPSNSPVESRSSEGGSVQPSSSGSVSANAIDTSNYPGLGSPVRRQIIVISSASSSTSSSPEENRSHFTNAPILSAQAHSPPISTSIASPRSIPTGRELTARDSPLLEVCSATPLRESTFNQRKCAYGSPPAHHSTTIGLKDQLTTDSTRRVTKPNEEKSTHPNSSPKLQAAPSTLSKTQNANEQVTALERESTQKKHASMPVKRPPPKDRTTGPSKRPLPKESVSLPPGSLLRPQMQLVSNAKPVIASVRGPLAQPRAVVPIVVPVADGDTTDDEEGEDGSKKDRGNRSKGSGLINKNSGSSSSARNTTNLKGLHSVANSSPNPSGLAFQSYLDEFLKSIRKNVDKLEMEKTQTSKKAKLVSAETSEQLVDKQDSKFIASEPEILLNLDQIEKPESTSTSLVSNTEIATDIIKSTEEQVSSKGMEKTPAATVKAAKLMQTSEARETFSERHLPKNDDAKSAPSKKRQASPINQSAVQSRKKMNTVDSVASTPCLTARRSGASTSSSVTQHSQLVDMPTPKTAPNSTVIETINPSDLNAKIVIERLTKRVNETRDQVHLSLKEKELLQTRQHCYNEYKGILRDLQQHTRLSNFNTRLGQDIAEMEKKLASMKKKREAIQSKALDLNMAIRDKSKAALANKKSCLFLAGEVKKFGERVIGDKKYKVPEIFVENINELIRSLKTMDSKQSQNLQRERGVSFKQLIVDEGTFCAASSSSSGPALIAGNVGATLAQALSAVPASLAASTLIQPQQHFQKKTVSSIPIKSRSGNNMNSRTVVSVADEKLKDEGKNGEKKDVETEPPGSSTSNSNDEMPQFISKRVCKNPLDLDKPEEGKQEEEVLASKDRLPLSEGDILSAVVTVSDESEKNSSVLLNIRDTGARRLDPHVPLCPASLSEGICENTDCKLQHI